MKKVLITGANGQLGSCLREVFRTTGGFNVVYTDSQELDITDREAVGRFFRQYDFDFCINAAAYTNVDKAEEEQEMAFAINADGAANLARVCKEASCVLFHISTDYVFDGTKQRPYKETDPTNPIGAYGASKLKGEQEVIRHADRYFIVRTSWLYSQYGHNFYNTVLRLYREGRVMTVTTEQTGAPTNANDLARTLVAMIENGKERYGIYHFSNSGQATWFDFARAILDAHPEFEGAKLEKTDHYRTLAARPAYSVLDNSKLSSTFGISPIGWRESLEQLIDKTL
jgi:dTDP-4-dehydrorhamnose reductase